MDDTKRNRIPGKPLSARRMLAVALLAGAAWMGACHRSESAASGAPLSPVTARVVEAERTDGAIEIELYGVVEAERSAAVAARVMAVVTSVPVRVGQVVNRGDVVVEIDPQASRGQLVQARGALAQARAALTLAQRNLARYEALAATEAASALELDSARMHYEQASGAVEQAEGAVRSASSIAADARVVAPFDGRVVRRMVDVGDLAAPGRPLLVIESRRGRRLSVEVPETTAARVALEPGVKVRVAIDSRPDLGVLEASVIEAAPGPDPVSHTVTAKVALPLEEVATGSSGRAWIETGRRPVVLVPAEAVLRRGGMTMVVLLTPEGRSATRVITAGETRERSGAERGDWLEVLSGLGGGEKLLTGLQTLPPAGSPVEVQS